MFMLNVVTAVGGWFQHVAAYLKYWIISRRIGVKISKILKPPPRCLVHPQKRREKLANCCEISGFHLTSISFDIFIQMVAISEDGRNYRTTRVMPYEVT